MDIELVEVVDVSESTKYVGISLTREGDSIGILREVLKRSSAPDSPSEHIAIELPCGQSVDYATLADFPRETVECKCGRLPYRHYFVEWRTSDPARNAAQAATLVADAIQTREELDPR